MKIKTVLTILYD